MKDLGDFGLYPAGTRVEITRGCEDFRCFKQGETGTVIRNSGKYLGIIVKLDRQRPDYPDEWNFNPSSLQRLDYEGCL